MWAAPPRWAPEAMSPLVPALATCLPGCPLNQAVLLGAGVHGGSRTSFVPSTAHVAVQSCTPHVTAKVLFGMLPAEPCWGLAPHR